MLITTFGPPSGYTQFCMLLIRLMAEEVLKDLDYIATDELEQMRTAWAERKHSHVLFFAHSPERAMVEIFLKLDRPLLILIENEDNVVTYLTREHGHPWPWGLRLTHKSVLSVGDLVLGRHTLVLRREYELTFREFLSAVAGHFEMAVTEQHLLNVMAKADFGPDLSLDTPTEAGFLARWEHARPLYAPPENISRKDIRAISTINAPLKDIMAGRTAHRFIWLPDVFVAGDQPHAPMPDVIELLGPARCIVFGPYLHLPVGRWTITVEFSVEENFSGNHIEIQFDCGGDIVNGLFNLPKQGVLQSRGEVEVKDPRLPVEIRITILQGAIEGQFELRSAIIDSAEH